MLKRTMKSNDDEVFPLGFGAMRLPTKNNSIDKDLAREIIYYGIDNGINFIDTAYNYHGGESESFLGEILNEFDSNGVKYYDKVRLSTKLPSWLVKSYEDMETLFEEQLNRLQTDSIDYYFIHSIDLSTLRRLESLGLYDFLEKLKHENKIKNIGFSYHGSKNEFKEVVDSYNWDMCLIQYNYLDTNIQAGTAGMKYAYSKDLEIFIMEPLKGGILADKLPKDAEKLFKNLDNNRSPANWALSWVLNHKEVTCVLSGMGNIDEINENITVSNKIKVNPLTKEELTVIRNVKKIINSSVKINCTSCGYCLECPQGVNIPECFNIYNEKHIFNLKLIGPIPHALLRYYMIVGGIMNKPAYAGLCNECGRCMSHCPQSINIPQELKTVSKEFEGHGFKYKSAFIKNIGLPLSNKLSKFFDFFKSA